MGVSIPVLFAVDEDERALREVERELVDRDARSYRVVCVSSAAQRGLLFHQSVSTFLLEWAHARRVSPHTVHVVGESWTRARQVYEVTSEWAT
jgi:hypothetical protein